MPLYDFKCEACKKIKEERVPSNVYVLPILCMNGIKRLCDANRIPSAPMVVINRKS